MRVRNRMIPTDEGVSQMIAFWRESGRAAQLAMVGLALSIGVFIAFVLMPPPAGSYAAQTGMWPLSLVVVLIGLVIPQFVVTLAMRSKNRTPQTIGAILAFFGGSGIVLLMLQIARGMFDAHSTPAAGGWLVFPMMVAIGVLDVIAAVVLALRPAKSAFG